MPAPTSEAGRALRVGIVAIGAGGGTGGAERFYAALHDAFAAAGHQPELVWVDCPEPDFATIQENYLKCYGLDLSRFDMVVSTKAPSYAIRHARHVAYLVHTIRVFYDMFEETFGEGSPEQQAQRSQIVALDTAALRPPHCRAVFTIGGEVSRRLAQYNGIDGTVIHPPLWERSFEPGPYEPFLFLPGRLHPWKRIDLLVEAMRHVRSPVELLIAGTGEAADALRERAADVPSVRLLGRVSDAALAQLYSRCLAVPFVPVREDYGYVTLEAFCAAKPVITCTDSGETLAFVRDGETGFVCPPDPIALAARIDQLHADRDLAPRLGAAARRRIDDMRWSDVVARLVGAAFPGART